MVKKRFVHRLLWMGKCVVMRNTVSYPHYPQMGQEILWITEWKSVNKIQKKEQKVLAKWCGKGYDKCCVNIIIFLPKGKARGDFPK